MTTYGGYGYVLDSGYIRKITLATGAVATVTGNGQATLGHTCYDGTSPTTTQANTAGQISNDGTYLYWVDSACYFPRRMLLATNAVTTFSNSETSLSAIVATPTNKLFGWNTGGSFIDSLDRASGYPIGYPNHFATLPTVNGNTQQILGVTADSSYLWVSARENIGGNAAAVLNRVDVTTGAVTIAYQWNDATITRPDGPVVNSGNFLYFATTQNRIVRLDKTTGGVVSVAGSSAGYADGTNTNVWFNNLNGIDTDGSALYLTDLGNLRIRKLVSGTALPSSSPAAWTAPLTMNAASVGTLAGTSTPGLADGTGTAASFNAPVGMSIYNGYGYTIDSGYVRKVSLATGAVTTVAGNGNTNGQCVDSLAPHSAQLSIQPAFSSAVVNDGTYLYWRDLCGLIRRMSLTTGAVSKVSANSSIQGIAVGPGGQLYGYSYSQLFKIDTTNGSIGSTLAMLPPGTNGYGNQQDQNITSVTSDGTNLWVSASATFFSQTYGFVDKIDVNTGQVTVVVDQMDNDIAGAFPVYGMITSSQSFVYIASPEGRVFRVDKAAGVVRSVAGASNGYLDDTAAQAWLTKPTAIESDGSNLYVVDAGSYRIRRLSTASPLAQTKPQGWFGHVAIGSGAVSTLAGSSTAGLADGTGSTASFTSPSGMAVAGGYGYTLDSGYLRRVNLSTGAVTTVAGTGNTGDTSCGNNVNPHAASVAPVVGFPENIVTDGTFLYWTDSCGNNQAWVRRMSLSTGAISTVSFAPYFTITVGPDDNLFGTTNNRIYEIDADTGKRTLVTELTTPVIEGQQYYGDITGLASDNDYLYAAQSVNLGAYTPNRGVVSRINLATGSAETIYLQSDATMPPAYGPMVATHDYLYVAGPANQIVRVAKNGSGAATVAGSATGFADGVGGAAAFNAPSGIDTDGANLYVADQNNTRIRRIGVAQPVSALPSATTAGYPANGVGPQESPGSGNASELCGCSQGQATSNPVNTATGAFWHKFDDLATPGRGIALHLSRQYVSSDANQDGLFGHGWNSTYDMGLSLDTSNGNVSVHQEDGSQVAFTPNSQGGFNPIQPRILATLSHNSGGYTFIRGKRLTYKFDNNGVLASIGDLNGNTTSLGYGADGNLRTVTDPAGRSYTFTQNDGHVVKVTDPANRTVTFSYKNGNLVSSTDPVGAKWTYTYDGQHRLLTMLDPNQQTATNPTPLTNVYDGSGRIIKQTDYAGRATIFDYASIAGAVKITDPIGNVQVDYYSNGRRTAVTNAYGTAKAATTSYTFDDTTGGIATVRDPLTHTTSYTYDGRGNLLTTTDALNHTVTNTYDNLNDQLTTTDPKGTTTTRTFDTKGNLTSSATPLKSAGGSTVATLTTTYQHSTTSHPEDVTGVTNANGKSTTFAYDAFGDQISRTAPPTPENSAGNKTTFTYNVNTGWKLTRVSPRGNLSGGTASNFTTNYAYDDDGQIVRIRDSMWTSGAPTQHQVTNTYDLNGNLSSSTDKKANLTTYTYDADNELTKTTLPNSTTTKQTWTANGQIKTSTDAANHSTTNTYDALDKLVAVTDPLNRTVNYTYDASGNLTLRASPGATCSGTTSTAGCTSYAYNAVNQLISRTYLDGATPAVTGISYDADGLRTAQTDASGSETATYDNLGRLSTFKDGAGTTVTYGYDSDGNVTSITYPGSSHTVTRTFDALDRLASVKDWNSNTVAFGYDADSNPTTATFPTASGETDTTTYDNLGAITGIADKKGTTTLAGFTYTRDANSMVATGTTTGITDAAQTYSRDALSRLTASGASSTPTSYGYSASDDITNRGTTNGGGSSTQTFNAADQLCWSTITTITNPSCGTTPTGATTYAYDVNGNRTASTTASSTSTYSYNQEQQLTKYAPPTGTATTYTYDGDGQRQTKTTGSAVTRFTWDKNTRTPNVLSDGANYYLYDNTGVPIEQISTAGTITWLHHDQLGSVRLLTNASGASVGSANFDPYGKKTASTGSVVSPFGFAGEYTDAESGFIFLRARYYDPATGQFMSRDPLNAETRQPYSYAANSPLDSVDPLGLCSSFLGCVGEHALSIDEGFANALTFNGVAKLDEALSPGSTCTYAEDGYYHVGEVLGVATQTYLTAGYSTEVRVAEGSQELANDSRVIREADSLPCNCFIAGTMVSTAHGYRPINQLRVGDKVWAKNLRTGRRELRKITSLFQKHAGSTMDITVSNGVTVTVTEQHPFLVGGVGWVMSGDLRVGDQLAERSGGYAQITTLTKSDRDVQVYSFTVAGDHNYFITDAQLLVHNCPAGGMPRSNRDQNRQFNDAIRSAERQLGRTLSKDERSQVHREIHGQDFGYHDIIDEILGMFSGDE